MIIKLIREFIAYYFNIHPNIEIINIRIILIELH